MFWNLISSCPSHDHARGIYWWGWINPSWRECHLSWSEWKPGHVARLSGTILHWWYIVIYTCLCFHHWAREQGEGGRRKVKALYPYGDIIYLKIKTFFLTIFWKKIEYITAIEVKVCVICGLDMMVVMTPQPKLIFSC